MLSLQKAPDLQDDGLGVHSPCLKACTSSELKSIRTKGFYRIMCYSTPDPANAVYY